MASFFRRSASGPWEYGVIGKGALEKSIAELTTVSIDAGQSPSHRPATLNIIGHLTGTAGTAQETPRQLEAPLLAYLSPLWRSTPKHICITAMEGVDLVAMDDTGKSDPFLEFSADAKSNYQFVTKATKYKTQTLRPFWGESVNFRNVKNLKGRDTSIDVTCWDFDAVGEYDYMGEFHLDLKKTF